MIFRTATEKDASPVLGHIPIKFNFTSTQGTDVTVTHQVYIIDGLHDALLVGEDFTQAHALLIHNDAIYLHKKGEATINIDSSEVPLKSLDKVTHKNHDAKT